MHESLVAARFQLLSDTASDALQHGYVILGGDFNAKVASRNDISGSDMDFLEDSRIAYHRGMSSPRENLHGRLLIDLCMKTSLLLGTGRLLGDMPALLTFFRVFRGSSGIRLDHFAMDRCMLARAPFSKIDTILITSLWSLVSASRHLRSRLMSLMGPLATLFPSCIGMDPKKDDYVSHLRDSGTALAECGHMVSAGDPAVAFRKLGEILIDAAKAAGCKHADGGRPSRGVRRDKPYIDKECRSMRAQFRYAMRLDPESVRVLARRFSTTIRRKCRQYRQRQTLPLLRHRRSNHKASGRSSIQ